MKMNIKVLDDNILSSYHSSVFLSKNWINLYDNRVRSYGIYNESGKIVGGFVLMKKRKLGINYFRPPMYMPNIFLFYENKSKNLSKRSTEEKRLMTQLVEFVETLPYHIISIYFPSNFIDIQPFIWKKFKVNPYYTYIIDLSLSFSEIENRFSPERRNDIKKAISDGIVCRNEYNPDIVKKLILNTFSRKGKTTDIKFLDKILKDFAIESNSFTFISYKDQIPLSVVFCIYDKEFAYYILGGYNNDFKHHGAGALAVDNAIRFSKDKGIKYFDFEGSMIPEVEKYFRGFGGQITPYYSANKAILPLEFLLKLVKRSVF